MKKIIVPVDFSVYSEYALEVASKIARDNNAEIYILHMLDISEQLISQTDATERREVNYFTDITQKRLDKFVCRDYMEGVKVTPMIKKSKVFKEVNNIARELEADLIVMGSRGAEGIKGYFSGSNTSKVVQTSDVPVLVVKRRQKSFKPKAIVFASDFSSENLPAYQKTKRFAALFNAKIKLVFVNTPNLKFNSTREIRERMRTFLNQNAMPLNTGEIMVYNDYSVENGIFNSAEDLKADMIAIPTHGRKGLNKLLSGNVSGEVADHSELPVITLKV